MADINFERIEAEKRNTTQVVEALLAAGYKVAVDYGEDDGFEVDFTDDKGAIVAALGACDEETLRCTHPSHPRSFVYFVYGNADDGSEVVADHGVSLSSIIDPLMSKWDA